MPNVLTPLTQSSHLGVILLPGKMSADLVVTTWAGARRGSLLECCGERPGMGPHTLQCTGQIHTHVLTGQKTVSLCPQLLSCPQ